MTLPVFSATAGTRWSKADLATLKPGDQVWIEDRGGKVKMRFVGELYGTYHFASQPVSFPAPAVEGSPFVVTEREP